MQPNTMTLKRILSGQKREAESRWQSCLSGVRALLVPLVSTLLYGCAVSGTAADPSQDRREASLPGASSKEFSQASVDQSAVIRYYSEAIFQAEYAGDKEAELRSCQEFLAALGNFPFRSPNEQSMRVRIAILQAKLGRWSAARSAFGQVLANGNSEVVPGRMEGVFWQREVSRHFNDPVGLASIGQSMRARSISSGHAGLSKTGAELVAQGLSADEVLDYAAGLWYINSGEDGEEGLARGHTLIEAVADAHPTNAFVNLGAALHARYDKRLAYGRRAFRYGSQTVRDAMVGSTQIERAAAMEARAMGLPYDHEAVPRRSINVRQPDGTQRIVFEEIEE